MVPPHNGMPATAVRAAEEITSLEQTFIRIASAHRRTTEVSDLPDCQTKVKPIRSVRWTSGSLPDFLSNGCGER